MFRSRAHLVLLAVLAAVLAGCVTENRPERCDADETTIELTVSVSALEPDDPAACRGQRIILLVRSEVDGVFHIHGLDAVVPATQIAVGEQVRLEFEAATSGQFPIELHPANDPQGVTLGIFAVHER
jgi:hypothetical protein